MELVSYIISKQLNGFTTFASGQYNARLWDIPFSLDWHKACSLTPVQIHNKSVEAPDRCDDRVSYRVRLDLARRKSTALIVSAA